MARTLRYFLAIPLAVILSIAVANAQTTPKKVSRAEALSAVASRVQPAYPPIAVQLKIEGSVELEAVVTESGTVEDVVIESGNPILTKPAAEALKKWKFAPFQEGGKPIKALAPITIVFKK